MYVGFEYLLCIKQYTGYMSFHVTVKTSLNVTAIFVTSWTRKLDSPNG